MTAKKFIDILTDATITEVELNKFTKVELHSDFIIYINKKAFIHALRLTSNAKINSISDFLRERYKTNMRNFEDELNWNRDMKVEIKKLLKSINKRNVIKIYNLTQFMDTISYAIESFTNLRNDKSPLKL